MFGWIKRLRRSGRVAAKKPDNTCGCTDGVVNVTPEEEAEARKLIRTFARMAGVPDPLGVDGCRCVACWMRWTVAACLGLNEPSGRVAFAEIDRVCEQILSGIRGNHPAGHWRPNAADGRLIVEGTLRWATERISATPPA